MQLIIDLNESDLIPIIEGYVKKLLRLDPYNQGELTTYLQQKTRSAILEQLNQIDLHQHIAEVFKLCFDSIVTDTVHKEIEKVVKSTVKELKNKGELLK